VEDMAKARPVSANDVADWFINAIDRTAGEVMTSAMVQKLVYLAQAWYLANKARPMFEDDFEAWATGPVCPAIFDRFEHHDAPILPEIENARTMKGDKLSLLLAVKEQYACYALKGLEQIVQEPGGPWHHTRGRLAPEASSRSVIAKEAIRKHYAGKIAQAA